MKKTGKLLCAWTAGLTAAALLCPVTAVSAERIRLSDGLTCDGVHYTLIDATSYMFNETPEDLLDFPECEPVCYYYTGDLTGILPTGTAGYAEMTSKAVYYIRKGDAETDAKLTSPEFLAELQSAFGYTADENGVMIPGKLWRVSVSDGSFRGKDCTVIAVEDDFLRTETPDMLTAFLAQDAGITAQRLFGEYQPLVLDCTPFSGLYAAYFRQPVTSGWIPYTENCVPADQLEEEVRAFADAHGKAWEIDWENGRSVLPQYVSAGAFEEILVVMRREFGWGPDLSTLPGIRRTMQADEPQVLYAPAGSGDVDENGSVNVADAVLLAQFNTEVPGTVVTAEGLDNADVNADGELNVLDVTALLEKIAHLGVS